MLFTDTSQCAAAWLWDFGDGIGTSNAQDPSYTYTGAGDYTVTLTATNTSGHSNSHQAAVTVRPLPQASFTAATPVCLGQVMTFTNTSTGATSYQWNFGDGQGSTAENPTHDYGAVGSYTVVLTATNAAGCFDVYSDTVTVANALDHIVVSPSSVTLAPGETQLFTATGYDQYGNEVSGLTFTWEVVNGGGIIDSSGVFTAGTTAGQYTDTVRATANGVSGYASVTVSGSQPTLFLPIILKMFP
jgi:PKD repeat protein